MQMGESNLHAENLLGQFIFQNFEMRSYYLLFVEGDNDPPKDTVASYASFYLWFIIRGRLNFRAAWTSDYELNELFGEKYEGVSLLEFYTNSLVKNDDRRHGFHYSIIDLKLGPFLSRADFKIFCLRHSFDKEVKELFTFWSPLGGKITPKVTIVGFHRSVLGIGEDARCLFECLCSLGLPVELYDVSPRELECVDNTDLYEPFEVATPSAPIIVYCLPVFEMMRAVAEHGCLSKERYKIGYWPWETTDLPRDWLPAFDFVDEIWASSTFLKDVYQKNFRKHIEYMPMRVTVSPSREKNVWGELFSGAFCFISVFDFNSRIERKNPIGAIDAFKQAFPVEGNVKLILKTIHGQLRPHDLNETLRYIGGDDRVIIVDGAVSRSEICDMISKADVYLSLHRSEGFGRPIAEAMMIGTPVIATGWSGCEDFLDKKTGYPVRCHLRKVGASEYPYAAGLWADPEVEHAANLMRALYTKGAEPSICAQASVRVNALFGLKSVRVRVAARLSAIRESMLQARTR